MNGLKKMDLCWALFSIFRCRARTSITMLGILMLAVSVPAAALDCDRPSDYQGFVEANYPMEIAFDVFRNDKLVGEHVTRFRTQGSELSVESRMALTIKLLFITAYEFEYQSSAVWCGDGLKALDVTTDRNGEVSRVTALADSGNLIVSSTDGQFAAPVEIMTTDHWNPSVLNRQQVLNTITGRINAVSIRQCEQGTQRIERAAPEAVCYQYSGELTTRVWYDPVGRWRGLEFTGDDGSTITYVCRRCT